MPRFYDVGPLSLQTITMNENALNLEEGRRKLEAFISSSCDRGLTFMDYGNGLTGISLCFWDHLSYLFSVNAHLHS